MFLVGLTGGLGSGKSTVAQMLKERGAKVVDADAASRELTEKGESGYEMLLAELGPDILKEDGELDREELARIVFADPAKREWLNGLLHPLIMQRMAEQLGRYADEVGEEGFAVVDVPLLVETGMEKLFRSIIVVLTDPSEQVARVKRDRGMSEEEAWARIRSQATNEQREAVADFVIENSGTLDELEKRVEEVWQAVQAKAGPSDR